MEFRQARNHFKRVLGVAKLSLSFKTKESFSSRMFLDFWRISNSVLNRGKSAILPLYNDPEVLSSASDNVKCFAGNFSVNSNLDDSENSLYAFPSKSNLKLHNIPVTPKFVVKVLEKP